MKNQYKGLFGDITIDESKVSNPRLLLIIKILKESTQEFQDHEDRQGKYRDHEDHEESKVFCGWVQEPTHTDRHISRWFKTSHVDEPCKRSHIDKWY